MRAILIVALMAGLAGVAGCSTTTDNRTAMAVHGNGGCYLGNGVYSGQRCPGQHP